MGSIVLKRNTPGSIGLTDAQGDVIRRADAGKILELSGSRWHWGPAPDRAKLGATSATVSVLLRKGYLLDVSERVIAGGGAPWYLMDTRQPPMILQMRTRYKLSQKGLRAQLYLQGYSVEVRR